MFDTIVKTLHDCYYKNRQMLLYICTLYFVTSTSGNDPVQVLLLLRKLTGSCTLNVLVHFECAAFSL